MDEATRISLKDQFNSLLVRAIEGLSLIHI